MGFYDQAVAVQYLEKLKKIPLFDALKEDDEALKTVLAICSFKKFKAGETIIEEGDMGSEMYIVLAGEVEIMKKTRAGDDYTVVVLKAEYNVFFGELALIDDDKRSATIKALKDSEFLIIHKKDFLKLGDQHPAIGLPVTRIIANILAGRLRKTTEDMMTLFDALVNEIQA